MELFIYNYVHVGEQVELLTILPQGNISYDTFRQITKGGKCGKLVRLATYSIYKFEKQKISRIEAFQSF